MKTDRNNKADSDGSSPVTCSARWVFECPICGKTVRPDETENHLNDHAEALREAEILIDEIMRGEVNPEDEAEKWLRAFAPQLLRPNDESLPPATNHQRGLDT